MIGQLDTSVPGTANYRAMIAQALAQQPTPQAQAPAMGAPTPPPVARALMGGGAWDGVDHSVAGTRNYVPAGRLRQEREPSAVGVHRSVRHNSRTICAAKRSRPILRQRARGLGGRQVFSALTTGWAWARLAWIWSRHSSANSVAQTGISEDVDGAPANPGTGLGLNGEPGLRQRLRRLADQAARRLHSVAAVSQQQWP